MGKYKRWIKVLLISIAIFSANTLYAHEKQNFKNKKEQKNKDNSKQNKKDKTDYKFVTDTSYSDELFVDTVILMNISAVVNAQIDTPLVYLPLEHFNEGRLRNYTVNHFIENLLVEDTVYEGEYSLIRREVKQGYIDSCTQANTIELEGFISPTIMQEIIVDNDSTHVDLYYQRKSYMLMWEFNGGTAISSYYSGWQKHGTNINTPILEKPGYTYTWNIEVPKTLTKSSHFEALWKTKQYEVEWMLNDGTDSIFTTSKVDYDTEIKTPYTLPNRKGYSFMGWSTNPSDTIAKVSLGLMTGNDTLNKKYYAVWIKEKYSVTWYCNDGTDEVFQIDSLYYDEEILAPKSTPKYNGFNFIGWSANRSDTVISQFGRIANVDGANFYAIWEINNNREIYTQESKRNGQTYQSAKRVEQTHSVPKQVLEKNTYRTVTASPNPTISKVKYYDSELQQGDAISVYNTNGELIMTMILQSTDNIEIDLSNYPQGGYIIEVKDFKTMIIKQ
ncbi:MAG: InlB B-repeat-containing protein [Salinivirgaceae bacterium]|nr:InlB B-repeat-containing protein [Salinivirgaceae bacterium]